MDDIAGRFEQADKHPGDVFNMDQRSPWAAVGLQPYAALRKGRAVRLFTTTSARSRSEDPYAVALRR